MSTEKTNTSGYFICLRRDQLGARLLMMLNCIRLSQDYGAPYRVNWFPRNAAAPKLARPEELFSQSYMTGHFIPNDDFEALEKETLPLFSFLSDEGPERLKAHLAGGGHVLLDEGFDVAVFPWEDREAVAARYSGFIREIGFDPGVAEKMRALDAVISPGKSGSVAYHIRRGDILSEEPWKHGMWPSKIEADELYFSHLKAAEPETVLVFSDLEECIGRLQRHHPQAKGINGLIDVSGCTPCQRDFLELYAMSRAEKIVAPVISAFSSAAARLSGKERLRFVDVLTPAQIDQAYDDVTARFEGKGENFANLSEAAHIFSRLSRHLAMNDREDEAYRIGRDLLDQGADNAFLPLLHAVNAIYQRHWDEAGNCIASALADPGLWKEDYVAGLALLAYVEASTGNTAKARKLWLQAFWTKPLLPDVMVVGSAMLDRFDLQTGPDLMLDSALLRTQRRPYLQRDILTVQGKIIRRKVVDFAALIVEWQALVLDRKARRILTDRPQLKTLRAGIAALADSPGRNSFLGLLQWYIGHPKLALRLTSEACDAAPDDFLVCKRRAEVLWMAGQPEEALAQLSILHAANPANPFANFLMAQVLLDQGCAGDALPYFRRAVSGNRSAPAMYSELADCLRQLGQEAEAADALQSASDLAPTFQKFSNQRQRILRRLTRQNHKNRRGRNG